MPQNNLSNRKTIFKYVVNGLFGNENFESMIKVTLET
jgi:hypothetical protein